MQTPVIIVPGGERPVTREPRWVALWRELGAARRELVARRMRMDSIEQAFAREIEPLERRLTSTVLSISSLLIDRYQRAVLDDASRSLLGLMIMDNLEQLRDHPFADSDAVASLRQRWRSALASAAAADSSGDGSSARLDRLLRPDDGASHRTEVAGEYDRDLPAGAAARDGNEAGARSSHSPLDIDAMLPKAGDDGDATLRRLINPLFRRLAQSLHPDREPDAGQRELKQSLMRTALKARGARDLDTLLTLHVEHVGEPLGGLDTQALERALGRQLEGMRRALRRLQFGDPLRRRIIERFDARDEPTRHRLIRRHAERLDTEHERLARTLAALSADDGACAALQAALEERRARELDRLAINELTGVG